MPDCEWDLSAALTSVQTHGVVAREILRPTGESAGLGDDAVSVSIGDFTGY